MVEVNEKEWDAMRRGKDRLEEMSELDKAICGANTAKHLIIPMSDAYALRRIAGVLNSLAASFDQLSRRANDRARSIILEARAEIDQANSDIRAITGKGKRGQERGYR